MTTKIKPVLVYDCSGEGWNRKNWNMLLTLSDSVIFVIDAQDIDRFSLAKDALTKFI